jgi:hypothetical protein
MRDLNGAADVQQKEAGLHENSSVVPGLTRNLGSACEVQQKDIGLPET